MKLNFIVPGEPRGKGRPRFSKRGHTYTDSETKAYENKIVAYYRKTHGAARLPDTAFICVDVIAYLPMPKSATKAQVVGMAGKTILPSRKPDVDNILKAVLDSLNGIAYKDDARVHRTSCVKFYSAEPRLEIFIKEVGD